ncbi:MAG: HD-GYP domain-containing protein [Acidobacteria bacterium]|nr:HD-GYP domain-containing protein [Acidobacteriota bacterium]
MKIARILFIRLLCAWAILSLIISGLVYFMERRSMEDHIVALALNEAGFVAHAFARFKVDPSLENRSRFDSILDHVVGTSFIIVEIYDQEKKSMLVRGIEQHGDIFDLLHWSNHDFPETGGASYRRIHYQGNDYFLVLTDLKDPARRRVGYFEGIFRVSPQLSQAAHREILGSVAVITGALLVAFLVTYPIANRLNERLRRRTNDVLRSNLGMLQVLGQTIAKHDSGNYGHNLRVALYAVRLARCLSLDDDHICNLIKGAFIHDLGKVAIHDEVLRKPGRLNSAEFEEMKSHVRHGADIIRNYPWLDSARDVVLYHHEKFDGSGYPYGLKGRNIPLNARIFAIADVFDALASERGYKAALPVDEVLAVMANEMPGHFDPELFHIFHDDVLPAVTELPALSLVELEEMARRLIQRHFTL